MSAFVNIESGAKITAYPEITIYTGFPIPNRQLPPTLPLPSLVRLATVRMAQPNCFKPPVYQ